MNTTSLEPLRLTSVRHDGWTGEAIAKFLETLADTGIVLEACDAAGKSSTAAYALRRREPLFGEAWQTALGIARDRLADTLLGRAIEGNVERIIKDGVIVAEKLFLPRWRCSKQPKFVKFVIPLLRTSTAQATVSTTTASGKSRTAANGVPIFRLRRTFPAARKATGKMRAIAAR